jgi:adenine-specific DNA-methyltransferase
VALIYPTHFAGGYVEWPKRGGKKPNAIVHVTDSAPLMIASGVYVLVRRFSSKEERRRVVAAVFDPERVPGDLVGFENHLNYFHANGAPLTCSLALGLVTFLNSTQFDTYFRQFNGHTQVNATDLRSVRYPTRQALEVLGERVGPVFPDQASLDALVGEALDAEQALCQTPVA